MTKKINCRSKVENLQKKEDLTKIRLREVVATSCLNTTRLESQSKMRSSNPRLTSIKGRPSKSQNRSKSMILTKLKIKWSGKVAFQMLARILIGSQVCIRDNQICMPSLKECPRNRQIKKTTGLTCPSTPMRKMT